jgi:hypothetical protein
MHEYVSRGTVFFFFFLILHLYTATRGTVTVIFTYSFTSMANFVDCRVASRGTGSLAELSLISIMFNHSFYTFATRIRFHIFLEVALQNSSSDR